MVQATHNVFGKDVQQVHTERTTAAQQSNSCWETTGTGAGKLRIGSEHTEQWAAGAGWGCVAARWQKGAAVWALSHSEDGEIGDMGGCHTALTLRWATGRGREVQRNWVLPVEWAVGAVLLG